MTQDTKYQQSVDNYQIDNSQSRLMSWSYIKGYLAVSGVILFIVLIYHLSTGIPQNMGPRDGGRPPFGGAPIGGMMPGGFSDIWPLWGQIVIPTLGGFLLGILAVSVVTLTIWYVYEKREKIPRWFFVALFGFAVIVLTNLFQGWTTGIYEPIGGASEIFQDAININNVIQFISNFVILQPSLSLHAQTQPPGAVLTIYFLYQIFGSADLIALGLAAIATFASAFFLDMIFSSRLDNDSARYGVLLFLLLPAVQVYYLANLYAIVATLMFGSIYFYQHQNQYISVIGSTLLIFLGTFTSFLFVYIGIFLLIYEISRTGNPMKVGLVDWIKSFAKNASRLMIIVLLVGAIYSILYLVLGFNYLNAFLFASALENPGGFMLFSNPVNYIVTRFEDALDIAIFFGPVLLYLCWKGIKHIKENDVENYKFTLSAFVALFILFLTGAPKKGETARICMFFLPFMLIPVLAYIKSMNISKRDRVILAVVVFIQAVIMQLFGTYIW